jgi:hypothetical protein
MENKNKKRILIGALIVLIIMNLAALGSFGYHKYGSCHKDKKECQKDQDLSKNPHDRIKDYVKKELKLNTIQFDKFCQLKDLNLKNTDSIWEQMVKLRELTQKEITKANPDSLRLIQMADTIGLLHRSMQLEMNRHFLAVKKILDPNQLIKYNEMIKNIDRKGYNKHGKNSKRKDTCCTLDKSGN